MRSLLPDRFKRGAAAPDATIIVLNALGDQLLPASGMVLARRGGREQLIGTLNSPLPVAPARSSLTGLRLPADMILHRDVVLPLAAERDLLTVLDYEIDRLTPFEANEVFWGFSGLRRDPVRGLRLTLMVVLRAPVERLLDTLERVNLKPSFVETANGRIELAAHGRSRTALQILPYGVCGVLALLCLVIPVMHQQVALARADRQIATLAPVVQEALGLRHRLTIAASGQAAVAVARQSGDPLQVLAALTAALPDGTSLSDLTLKSGDLTIDGQSDDAAGLIAKLASVSAFRDPGFIAPVTRAVDGQAEVFSIHIAIAP